MNKDVYPFIHPSIAEYILENNVGCMEIKLIVYSFFSFFVINVTKEEIEMTHCMQ